MNITTIERVKERLHENPLDGTDNQYQCIGINRAIALKIS